MHRHSSKAIGLPALLAGMLVVPTAAAAQTTLLSNFPPEGAEQVTGISSFQRRAASFRMGLTAYELTRATLRLGFIESTSPTPVVELRADNGTTVPGATVLTGFTNPSFGGGNNPTTYHFTPTSAVTLQANTKYWLYVYGGPEAYYWYRSTADKTPTSTVGVNYLGFRRSTNEGVDWEADDRIHTFELEGTARSESPAVPEPSAIVVLLPALGLLIALKRPLRRHPSPSSE